MNGDQDQVWLGLLGLLVLIIFWRVILRLIIAGMAVAVGVHVWSQDGAYSVETKVIASVIVIAFVCWLMPGSGRGDRASKPSYKRHARDCSVCNSSGQIYCYACQGSGQAPESRLHTLGLPKDCPYCGGKGRIRCNSCSGRGVLDY